MKELKAAILDLKRRKNAVILAHYYQESGIQDVADFIGDSLGLSQQAAQTKADIIVFAGVHFMAETAKILNPDTRVLLPDLNAGCSLSESCPAEKFEAFRNEHPRHIAITYINCSAKVKALSDIVCTSSNALTIIESIPKDVPILFAPDKNLGAYLNTKTGRNMLLWDGVCEVHAAFSMDKLRIIMENYPLAKIIAHPESEPHILEIADFIGSTKAMLEFVQNEDTAEFIVATEAGILHQMRIKVPLKKLIPVPIAENNACACSECRYMKMNTLEKLYQCLLTESPEINLKEEVIKKALKPLERMLELSE